MLDGKWIRWLMDRPRIILPEPEKVPQLGVSPMFDNWVKSLTEGMTEEEIQEFLKSDVAKSYARKLGII